MEDDSRSSNFGPVGLLHWLDYARRAVPAVKYAIGVAGLAIATALVIGVLGHDRAVIILMGGMFVSMVLLFVFSRLVEERSKSIRTAGTLLLWVVVLFFSLFLAFTISAATIGQPLIWARFLSFASPDPGQSIVALSQHQRDLTRWLCKALRSDFDFQKAASSFPLASMSNPTYSRKMNPTRVDNQYVSESPEYRLKYTFQSKLERENEPYGFQLLIEEKPAAYPSVLDTQEKAEAWLSQFGKVESSMFGREVGVGPPMFSGPPFKFAVWPGRNSVQAEWFDATDIDRSRALCSSIHESKF